MKYIFLIYLMFTSIVFAAPFDKKLPINYEADSVAIDQPSKTRILEGKVIISQGVNKLQAEKIIISEDAQGFQKAQATGKIPNGLIRFTQKEKNGLLIEAEAERAEYDDQTKTIEFFQRAKIKRGDDLLSGNYILYDTVMEKFEARNSKIADESTNNRVIGVFVPKNEKQTKKSIEKK